MSVTLEEHNHDVDCIRTRYGPQQLLESPLRPRDPNINSWPDPISSRLGLLVHYQQAQSLLRGDFGRNAWDAP